MRKEHVWLLLLVLLTVMATPFFTTATINREPVVAYHGLPFPFLEQHTTLTPLPEDLPLEIGFLDPREHPTDLLWGPLIVDIAIVGAAYLGLWRLAGWMGRSLRRGTHRRGSGC